MLRDEFGIDLPFRDERRDGGERFVRTTPIVAMAREHQRCARIARGRALQQWFGFRDTSETQQQFAERGQRRRPVRIERECALQRRFRAGHVAERGLAAAEQTMRFGEIGLRRDDVLQFRVRVAYWPACSKPLIFCIASTGAFTR